MGNVPLLREVGKCQRNMFGRSTASSKGSSNSRSSSSTSPKKGPRREADALMEALWQQRGSPPDAWHSSEASSRNPIFPAGRGATTRLIQPLLAPPRKFGSNP
ncbi:mCG148149 [Mus musculus]|uniref:Slc36a3 protein n=1 Tax=Mus musculus TaxID=10090 RepID=Q810P4_MOUSE|nr:Slc36a3 protein [Mus musculus]EDL33500.1 mCG148149 [Mus musculus]